MSEPQSQAAPAPDYSTGGAPEIELCSCEEALALRVDRDEWKARAEQATEALRVGILEGLAAHQALEARAEAAELYSIAFESERVTMNAELATLSAEVERLRARLALVEAASMDGAAELVAAEFRLAAAIAAIHAAGLLFERMACDDHRHPPDDRVAPETWERVCCWQARPEVLDAMSLANQKAKP